MPGNYCGKTPSTAEERTFLEKLPKPAPEDPEREWTMELLYHFIKKKCLEREISAALLFPKGDFNRLKSGSPDFDQSLLSGWRAELMGAELVELAEKREAGEDELGGRCLSIDDVIQ